MAISQEQAEPIRQYIEKLREEIRKIQYGKGGNIEDVNELYKNLSRQINLLQIEQEKRNILNNYLRSIKDKISDLSSKGSGGNTSETPKESFLRRLLNPYQEKSEGKLNQPYGDLYLDLEHIRDIVNSECYQGETPYRRRLHTTIAIASFLTSLLFLAYRFRSPTAQIAAPGFSAASIFAGVLLLVLSTILLLKSNIFKKH